MFLVSLLPLRSLCHQPGVYGYCGLICVPLSLTFYSGGVWKLDGKALITANAEYRNLIKEEIQPFGRYESINLEVKFTLYYDYSKEIVTDTIIKHVNRLVA